LPIANCRLPIETATGRRRPAFSIGNRQLAIGNPRIIAHRGLHRGTGCPENSLGAFEAAWAAGVAWCECDIRVTADHRTIVLHDPTLDRTTTCRGRVDLRSYDELKTCRLRDEHGRSTNEPVPLLHDVVRAMPSDGGLLIEIKPHVPTFHHVARVMLARGWRLELQSFDPENVAGLCSAGLGGQAVLLIEDLGGLDEGLRMRCCAIHVQHELVDADVVARLHAAGKRVGAWTVNDVGEARRLARLGVDTLITDDPLGVRRALGP
jgi:glycerophosphoryl diester phosphodiesterase